MSSNILEQQDQPDPTDDTAGDGKRRSAFSTCEHCHEKQRAKPDDGEGPEETPVHVTKELACQSHETEDNQERACDQRASIGAVYLHFILLSCIEILFLTMLLPPGTGQKCALEDLLFFTQKWR